MIQKILAIARKDTLIRFASPSELLFFIILPLVFTLLLSGGTPNGSADTRIGLPIVDEAQSNASRTLIAELESSSAIRPLVVDRKQADRDFNERRTSALMIIPRSFALDGTESELELRVQPNNIDALIIEQAVQNVLTRLTGLLAAAAQSTETAHALRPFESEQERLRYFEQALVLATALANQSPPLLATTTAQTVDRILYNPVANSSAGQLITWVFIPLLGLSGIFAFERSQGTLRRLLASPSRRSVFLLGTIGGQVAIALVQMALLVGFGVLALGLPWGREPLALAILLGAFALAAAALGTALGTCIKTEEQSNGLSTMLGMVMALLGGCWYPIELFPTVMQSVVRVLPTTWAMQGLLDLVMRGGTVVDILPESGVLLGFAAVFFLIGTRRL